MPKTIRISHAELTKLAMPIRPTPTTQQKMKEEGWFVDPEAKHSTPLPEVGVRKIQTIDKNLDISLPKIYKLYKKDVRVLNGKEYIIIDWDAPKQYQRVPKDMQNKVDANGFYPGQVRAINVATGNVEKLPFEVMQQAETQATNISEESRKKINAEIVRYNQRIDELDAATANLARLPLQLGRVDSMLNERIATLQAIIANKEDELAKSKTMPKGVEEFHGEVEQALTGGGLAEKDFIDHVLYRYIHHYDNLVEDLKNDKLQIPQNISNPEVFKEKLLGLGQMAFDELMKSKQPAERPARDPFNIIDFNESKLEELPLGSVPNSHKAKGYRSYEAYLGSLYNTIQTAKKDLEQLTSIKQSILDLGKIIASSPKDDTSLSTPEGQAIVQQLSDVCNNALAPFVERYARDIVDNGRIDTRKMGSGGQVGNAFLIVVFVRIYKIISTMLAKAGKPIKPIETAVEAKKIKIPVQDTPQVAQPEMATAQGNCTRIKLSRAQWEAIGKKANWIK